MLQLGRPILSTRAFGEPIVGLGLWLEAGTEVVVGVEEVLVLGVGVGVGVGLILVFVLTRGGLLQGAHLG